MTVKNYFPAKETRVFDAGGGLTRKVGAHADNAMVVEVRFETGTVAARHHHPHEQITYVISGKFEFTIGDDTYIVSAGDSLYKQPNIEHGATCLEAGTLLDIFTPRREDFL
ncbi:cupin domain-containing protein [Mameliella sediminis]|uniref:cupin domain-containing protein n=1 Tax=Mameliella sediminis TaxID=2836866 RepID=UPI001C44A921|nr:cupin domain-containing protein [Mameliella sediminis]MBY6116984.1 cupin domain-containing protein [Antarctobacter heliothermus]MBY6146737.1 cupin domain-containing protein [Mameliella alba]MBV7397139.1 cupin domain-containing protein [Mameliella sediminis]MBY6163685.1 cupin domain-containing protein [Mameliella alba]MBY6171984.1 cupin domain-containing protein [Mameliella alba]